MNLVQRVKDILLTPKTTWPQIEQEPADAKSLYANYIVFLAAIPAIASFIGLSLFGVGAFGVSYRVPVLSGLVHMVVGYLLSLGMVFVLALLVDALAPTFGGVRNPVSALKLVAYGATASFVGGIFGLLPSLSILALLFALYTIYLIYTGLPVVMKCPPDKAVGYTATIVVCGVVAGVLVALVSAAVMPSRGMGMAGLGGDGGELTISTPGGKVSIDTNKMEEVARKMEAAGKRMETAQQSGDPAAAGQAMGEMLGALAGGGGTPIAAQDLKALLPATLLGLPRQSYEARSGQAMGIGGSGARASYGTGPQRVDLTITDMGGIGAFALVAGFAAGVSGESETDGKVEKTYRQGGRTVHEEFRKDGSHADVTVFLGNGIMVSAAGQQVDATSLKRALDETGLDRIESLKRAGKS